VEIQHTTISGRSVKQSETTSSNHAKLLSSYEANRERVWLKSLIQHIQDNCSLSVKNSDVSIQQVCSCESLAYLFSQSHFHVEFYWTTDTKILVSFISDIIVFMRVRYKCVLHSFSLHHGFVPLSFPGKVFNEAVQTQKDVVFFFLH
jgi:hypothetical protein